MFNINYYRPSYFALEAEPELSRFVAHFKCSINDPQDSGMGDGPYSPQGFLAGWNHGNEFGYSSILGQEGAVAPVTTKPTAELEAIWKWNFDRDRNERAIKEDIFIPRIFFMKVDGVFGSVAVWPDGISTLVPATDFLYIPRKELAPRGPASQDECIIPRSEYADFLSKYASDGYPLPAYKLPAPEAPKEVKDFVRSLSSFHGTKGGIAADRVLNSELVQKYRNPVGSE